MGGKNKHHTVLVFTEETLFTKNLRLFGERFQTIPLFVLKTIYIIIYWKNKKIKQNLTKFLLFLSNLNTAFITETSSYRFKFFSRCSLD